jgi:hypothetical protein
MNTCVQAGPLTISLVAKLGLVKVSTTVSIIDMVTPIVELTCLPLFKLTLNGHSISAINPELILLGGMATLAMA